MMSAFFGAKVKAMHALIIEDEPLIAMMIEDELRDMGFTTFDVAVEEQAAIHAAELRCPDLITADERLAQGSGIEAVKVICLERAIAVVFIVGNPHSLKIPDAVSLVKPFLASDLRVAVEKARQSVRTYA